MMEPACPQKAPFEVEVVEGRKYFWCACGRSKKQPFCDGSHADSGFQPVKYEAKRSGKKFFCGCKRTNNKPFCDGSHSAL